MFGRMMNSTLGKIHFWLTFVFYNLAFFPMHEIGLQGHMRRIYDPTQYAFLQPLQPTNRFISIAVFLLIATQFLFLVNFFWSMWKGEEAEDNPWKANSLEWTVPSPPPHGNFETMPVVYRGPYEYSSPEAAEDYLPQNVPPDQVGGGGRAAPQPTPAPAPAGD